MSQQLPFENISNDFILLGSPGSSIYTGDAAMSDDCNIPEYHLDMIGPIGFHSHGFYYDAGLDSSPLVDPLPYQQSHHQLILGPMFHELSITQPYNPSSFYGPPNAINPTLRPSGAAEIYAATPITQATSPATNKVKKVASNRCGGDCEGKFEGPHQCNRVRQLLSVRCLSGGCQSILTTRVRFNKHWNIKHRNGGINAKQKLNCPFSDCKRTGDKGFSRKDNLRQHRRNVHNENIPKERLRYTGSGTTR